MFGLKTKIFLTAVVLVGGSGFAAYKAGIIGKPGVEIQDRGDWGEVTDDSIEVITEIQVQNPNDLAISLNDSRVDYRLFMNEVKLARGTKNGINIQKGNSTHTIQTTMLQGNIPAWWVKHLNRGERTEVKAVADISINLGPLPINLNGVSYTTEITTDIISMLDSSLEEMEGEYKGPGVSIAGVSERPTVEITDTSAKWGEVNREKTELIMGFNLHNPNDYPIPTPQLNGDLRMNSQKVAAWQANEVTVLNAQKNAKIDPGDTRNIKYLVEIKNQKIDEWLTSHVKKEEKTDAELKAQLGFDFGGTTITVPLDGGMRCGFSIQTGILVDNQNSTSSFNGCQIRALGQSTGQNKDNSSETDLLNSGGSNSSDSENPIKDIGGL